VESGIKLLELSLSVHSTLIEKRIHQKLAVIDNKIFSNTAQSGLVLILLCAPAQTKILMLLTACEKDVKIASKMLVTHPIKSTTVKSATFGLHRNFGRSHNKAFTFTT